MAALEKWTRDNRWFWDASPSRPLRTCLVSSVENLEAPSSSPVSPWEDPLETHNSQGLGDSLCICWSDLCPFLSPEQLWPRWSEVHFFTWTLLLLSLSLVFLLTDSPGLPLLGMAWVCSPLIFCVPSVHSNNGKNVKAPWVEESYLEGPLKMTPLSVKRMGRFLGIVPTILWAPWTHNYCLNVCPTYRRVLLGHLDRLLSPCKTASWPHQWLT